MKSQVYFIPVDIHDKPQTIQQKCQRLLEESRLLEFLQPQDRAVIKIHFGEEGNKGFVNPDYAAVIAKSISTRQAVPILSDTNTLYRGRRTNSQEHLKLAAEHGFTKERTGAEIIIPEDKDEDVTTIQLNGKYIQTAKVSSLFLDADALIDVSHFKGHLMTGFGGALKNIGMGCASREGKLAQHANVSPMVYTNQCVGCGACVEVCPVDAITLKNDKSTIDAHLCIGCASCIAACTYSALDVPWESGSTDIQEKMVEYAKAVLDNQAQTTVCINFAIKITKECDCLAKDDPRVCRDLGILASTDPVAIDKASYDLVVKASGRDIFRDLHPTRDGHKQLNYAAELKCGSLDYELIEIGA